MSKTLSTHVLDATTGNPAAGIRVELRDRDGATLTTAETDSDGRIPELAPGGLTAGREDFFTPRAGVLVMFPSWLVHAVRPYVGTRTRISIAFNLSV